MKSTKKPVEKILVVDDSKLNREMICDILEGDFNIIEAENGIDAVEVMRATKTELSVVLLDINMPKLNGLKVLEIMKEEGWLRDLPVIMISSERSRKTIEKCYELGATDYISRPFDSFIIKRRVANTIMLYAKQRRLEEMVIDQIYQNEKDNRILIEILSHIVEFRNGESGDHIMNINIMTSMLLEQLSRMTDKYDFSPKDISLISTASAMHDIGKISIPSEILNKPGKLTHEEFEIIKQHSVLGADMLKSARRFGSEKLIQEAYKICRWHHERYDGKGYPDGLVGEDIPISAQVVAIADVYDALTSERCYKVAYSHDTAINMILKGQCGAFNPLLIDCLIAISPKMSERLKESIVSSHSRDQIAMMTKDIFNEKETIINAHKSLDELVSESLLKEVK